MVELKHRIDGNFVGTLSELLDIFPEKSVDKILNILELGEHSLSVNKPETGRSNKMTLWEDVVHAIRMHSKPTDTIMGLDLASKKKYLKQLKVNINNTKELLEALTYEKIYPHNSEKIEFYVGDKLRRASIKTEKNANGKRKIDICASGTAESYFVLHGKYPELYPLDNSLKILIGELKNFEQICLLVEEDISHGKIKKNYDEELVFSLCWIYYSYTGLLPNSNPSTISKSGEQKFSGNIIPFLKEILPHSHYAGSHEDAALRQMIIRLKKQPNKKKLWQNNP